MASNKLSDVKFIAISRLTDRKTILAMNPNAEKKQYNSEVSFQACGSWLKLLCLLLVQRRSVRYRLVDYCEPSDPSTEDWSLERNK